MTTDPTLTLRTDGNADASAIDRAITRRIAAIGPSMLVKVTAVHNAGVSLTGTIDAEPMVHQQDALGNPQPHGPLYGVPYLRIQGGTSAFICDPQVGDIGFVIVAGRDHTNAIANRAPSNPASFRMFDMADCVYVGGYLNAAPTQYVHMTDTGIRIVSPGTVSIQATEFDVQCPMKVTGPVTSTGDQIANGISQVNHVHAGVESGSGTSGPPE